jgi:hypothetical protein
MAWITPVTFVASDYYNASNLNRVDNNTDYIYDMLIDLGYVPSVSGISTSRDRTSLTYYDDLNRIEGNIKNLADNSYEPVGWTTPKTTWVSVVDAFDYTDANRLETNLLALKTMIDSINDALLYCGDTLTTICGKSNTLF